MNTLPRKRHTILLVENDLGDQELTRRALALNAGESPRLLVADDGRDAKELLESEYRNPATHGRPEIILLDWNMPVMDGRGFLRWMRNHEDFHTIPVIVLSTSDGQEDICASYALGAASFITKPPRISELAEVLDILQTYWFDVVRLPET